MTRLAAPNLRRARLVDRAVAAAITTGGSLILLAVAFLMIFLVAECVPLLRTGSARPNVTVATSIRPLAAVEDEYRESVTLVGTDGALHPVRREGVTGRIPLDGTEPPLRQAVASNDGRLIAVADAAGVHVFVFRTRVTWQGERRVLEPSLRLLFVSAAPPEDRLLAVAGSASAAVVLVATPTGAEALGGGEDGAFRLTLAGGAPAAVGALTSDAAQAWVASAGQLAWFAIGDHVGAGTVAPQATAPLSTVPTAAAMVLGDATLLLGDNEGNVTAWQAVNGPVAGERILDAAGRFPGHGRVRALAPSARDKVFAVLRDGSAELAQLTSRRALLDLPSFPSDAALIGISPRRDGCFAVSAKGSVHRWGLHLFHPEVSLGTLFLPVRYEGYTKPELVWQSSGGSSSFEPKLSLVPLLVGTLKGALYALIFSAPCALAAALYVSQFAPSRLRQLTKPVVELMAALPSVVVGFLAALFLAPLLQRNLVGTLAVLVVLPVVIALAGLAWSAAPIFWRTRLGRGRELVVVAALMAITLAVVYANGHRLEAALFGGDFPVWLASHTGVTYDQRNAVVVGFALGFAVIPIIFTLAEDAFSNVPPSLISASLALGATPWQAATTVAIPAASPGLFAAVMIGLGRAIGETMIVLMATGNTPILSLSPFDGMRTMSASIAVELPEAPYGGSLFRVLMLAALLLFAITFVLNTVAVLVAARLRRRFGRLAA